jgi:hypothetical protein
MVTLVSPGVSVTVTDESFFIPTSSPTVPLFFIATQDEKNRPDGVTPADGTFEYDVIRTITSLRQSTNTYGVPSFLEDPGTGSQHHGDARNEYGLFALNQFLGVGNRAFVIRANVNLNDDLNDIRDQWDSKFLEAKVVLENLANEFINEFNSTNGFIPGDAGFKQSLAPSELVSLSDQATTDVFLAYSFRNSHDDYTDDQSAAPFNVHANGYTLPPTGVYNGLTHIATNIASFPTFPGSGLVAGEFTPQEAGDLLIAMADDFKFTVEFLNNTSLGANDAARRFAITTALQASINSNTDIRSENFDFNLVLTPGYPEAVDEMFALVVDIQEEALVIADAPVDRNADGITNPSTGWAASTARVRSEHIAYYYPWGLASNLDGKNVVVAASGIAIRTYAHSDDVSFLWFAPAGLRRGLISGITNLGYVSGQLGGPTTFVDLSLNLGQRDALYQYAPSGDINPLTFYPGKGFVVWGQKTSAVAASAMDRVNVSRLIKYIKRQLRRNTLIYVFEPNDQITRDALKATVDGFLNDLVAKRGLFDFVSVSDESNNTPDRIDRNEMYIDIALKPVRAAEFIYIPIRIVATGAEI